MRKLLLPLLAVPSTVGCLAEEVPVRAPTTEQHEVPAERVVVSSLIMVGMGGMVGGGTANGAERGTPPSEVVAAAAERLPREPVFFHLGAGYAAVGHVDLTPCRARGLDPGYVHLRVTFGGGGTVVRALVESLAQPSPDALACISERLAGASVPVFQGDDVTLSKSAYIAPDNRALELFVNSGVTPPGGTL